MVMLFCKVEIPEGGIITLTFDDGSSKVKEVNYKKFVKVLPDELKGKDEIIFAQVVTEIKAKKPTTLNNAKDVIERLKQEEEVIVYRPEGEF